MGFFGRVAFRRGGPEADHGGAEAVALSYVHAHSGWTVKRRLQQGERADWLLIHQNKWLALEVSGSETDDLATRLGEKRAQVAACTLPVTHRLAVVVGFEKPRILSGGV